MRGIQARYMLRWYGASDGNCMLHLKCSEGEILYLGSHSLTHDRTDGTAEHSWESNLTWLLTWLGHAQTNDFHLEFWGDYNSTPGFCNRNECSIQIYQGTYIKNQTKPEKIHKIPEPSVSRKQRLHLVTWRPARAWSCTAQNSGEDELKKKTHKEVIEFVILKC